MRSLTNDPGSLVVTALQRAGAKRFRLWSALGVAGEEGPWTVTIKNLPGYEPAPENVFLIDSI